MCRFDWLKAGVVPMSAALLAGCFQAQLHGPVSDATITVSELRNPQSTITETTSWSTEDAIGVRGQDKWDTTSAFGRLFYLGVFTVESGSLDDETLYLVTASGGADTDHDRNKRVDDTFTPVSGEWHAIMTGEHLKGRGPQVSALTEGVYQWILPALDQLDDDAVLEQLDRAAQALVDDVTNDGNVDYLDVLRWSRLFHDARLKASPATLDALSDELVAGDSAVNVQQLTELLVGLDVDYGYSVTGRVIDPEIADALVCLDLDGDFVCDSDEPTARTDDSGAFEILLQSDPPADANVMLINTGSFTDPAYGYHNGIPFDLQLFARLEGETDVLVTPLSTLMAAHDMSSSDVADAFNQFSDALGGAMSADDVRSDPLANVRNLSGDALTEEDLKAIRANVVAYGTQKVMASMKDLPGYIEWSAEFNTGVNSPGSGYYGLLEMLTVQVGEAINTETMNQFQAIVDAGNEQLSAFGQPPMPDLDANLILNVATPSVDYLTDVGVETSWQAAAGSAFDGFQDGFDTIFPQVQAAVQNAQSALDYSSIGAKIYGLLNRETLLAYPGPVQEAIFSSVPGLEEGVKCGDIGFILIRGVMTCTDEVPRSIVERYKEYYGSTDGDGSDEPVHENVWDNMTDESILYTDQTNDTCTLTGRIVDESGTGIEDAPVYFSDSEYDAEAYASTDAEGNFTFENIPAAPGEQDRYSFGALAGARRGTHQEFQGNSDYSFDCQSGAEVDETIPLKEIEEDTRIEVQIDEAISATTGWELEIRSDEIRSEGVDDGGYINEAIEKDTSNHPYVDYDDDADSYYVEGLSGGDYYFRYKVDDTLMEPVDTETFTVPAGATTSVTVDADGTVESE